MSHAPELQCDCKSGKARLLFQAADYVSGDEFQIFQCSACGLAFTFPAPASAQWERYYPAAYYGELDSGRFPAVAEALQNQLYAHRVRQVERLSGGKAGSVLDIGCGRGFLLCAFQRRGWQVTGTEMSEPAAAYARQKLNLPVHIGDLAALRLPENSLDAVVMWHVLEHFPRANEILREVHRVLRPGGILLVAVPNFGSFEARVARDKWFHLDVPRHLTHFTPRALTHALEQNGFRIEKTSGRSLEYDCFSATQSFLNRVGLKHNFLYNLLRRRGARTFGDTNKAQLIAHVLLLPVAAIAGFVALAAGGSTQVLYARKT